MWLYNIYLHPLKHYPGPKLWAASNIPYTIYCLTGTPAFSIAQLHSVYGDIVRVVPNRLSYTHPDAWTEIRGRRNTSEGENPKDPTSYLFSARNILGANRPGHARFRRALADGFSAKTMQLQKPLITQYVDLLLDRLKAKAKVTSPTRPPSTSPPTSTTPPSISSAISPSGHRSTASQPRLSTTGSA